MTWRLGKVLPTSFAPRAAWLRCDIDAQRELARTKPVKNNPPAANEFIRDIADNLRLGVPAHR